MKHIYSFATFALASIGMIVFSPERSYGQTITAVASGSWFSDWDNPAAGRGTVAPGATASAGGNLRRVGGTTATTPQVTGTYAAGGADAGSATLSGTISSATTISYAFPQGPLNVATNTYNYVVSSFASVLVTPVSSSAQASATANDPQFVATPGIFGETLGLGAGAQLFSDPTLPSNASLDFQYNAINILSSPIASIDISSTDGSTPTATVLFNSDPEIQFFAPGTTTAITASQVASILNSSSVLSQLTSSGGLSSNLALFDFNIDLTGATLSPNAGFGAEADGNASASPIPEPSSYAALTGLLALGAAAWRRRQAT
jgi:hypothetical protein